MKTIDIREQPVLSLGRTARITIEGIRYRLFRSLVTVGVVAVAVAFLMNILSTSLIKRSIVRDTRGRIRELRLAAVWASRLTAPETLEEILLGLARARPGDAVYRSAGAHGGISADDMVSFHEGARKLATYLDFFSRLDYGRRRKLVHAASGTAIFDRLRTEEGWDRFESALKELKSVRFVTSVDEFREFLSQWPAVKALGFRVVEGRTKAVARMAEALAGRPVMEALAGADGAFGDAVREAGFALDSGVARALSAQAARILDMRFLERSIADSSMRQAVAGLVDVLPKDVTVQTMWDVLGSRRHASWYLDKLRSLGLRSSTPLRSLGPRDSKTLRSPPAKRVAHRPPVRERSGFERRARNGGGPWTPLRVWIAEHRERGASASDAVITRRVVEFARVKASARRMARAERIEAAFSSSTAGGGFLGLGARMGWLVLVSMLVCVVGISNAMLMSVTERFREIATLKCLGALDRFIMLMFLLEASLLGVVGGVVGAVLGALLGTAISLVAYGALVLPSIPFGELLGWIVFSVVLGVVLAAVASVYPSFKAARLAPMEAMRIE